MQTTQDQCVHTPRQQFCRIDKLYTRMSNKKAHAKTNHESLRRQNKKDSYISRISLRRSGIFKKNHGFLEILAFITWFIRSTEIYDISTRVPCIVFTLLSLMTAWLITLTTSSVVAVAFESMCLFCLKISSCIFIIQCVAFKIMHICDVKFFSSSTPLVEPCDDNDDDDDTPTSLLSIADVISTNF